MKKLILVLSVFFLGQTSFAQTAWSGQGDNKLQVGFNAYGSGTGLKATYDFGVHEMISVGVGGDFYFKDNKDSSNFFLYGRGNVHLNKILDLPAELDLYPGLSLGILGNTFGWGIHAGARYFFTPKFGAFLELGNRGGIGVSINL
ncbi:MAG: hypothetical protein KBA33_08960 [Cloacibacterium sp.]|jgi:hypothetical protein|nr:hypothetical protein [Cloacibacterium sp.]